LAAFWLSGMTENSTVEVSHHGKMVLIFFLDLPGQGLLHLKRVFLLGKPQTPNNPAKMCIHDDRRFPVDLAQDNAGCFSPHSSELN
jgi:hypothetical protein